MTGSNQTKQYTPHGEWGKKKEKADESAGRKRRALLESCVGFSVGLIIFFLRSHLLGAIVFCIAGLVFVGGQFYPPIYEAIKKFGLILAKIVGVTMTWLLLVPFFYICFTFGRILLLVSRKDPLSRKFPSDEKSYWVPRKSIADLEYYKKQY